MGRPRWHPGLCRNFEKPGEHAGPVSARGLCEACGREALNDNIEQMEARSGPNFVKWRRSMVACAYPELLDVLDSRP